MTEAGTQTQMTHAPGSFCWIELATTDGPGAKKFYSELFGWEAEDSPVGPDMVYTMLRLKGKDVGALYQKGEMMKDVPTHWASYISVKSADETVATACASAAIALSCASVRVAQFAWRAICATMRIADRYWLDASLP